MIQGGANINGTGKIKHFIKDYNVDVHKLKRPIFSRNITNQASSVHNSRNVQTGYGQRQKLMKMEVLENRVSEEGVNRQGQFDENGKNNWA